MLKSEINVVDEIMSLVDNFGYALELGCSKVSTVLRTELQTAIEDIVEQSKWSHHTPKLLSDADAMLKARKA